MLIHTRRVACALLLALLFPLLPARAADTAQQAAIRSVLETQAAAWNQGDVVRFMQGYKNSPDTTFVGKTVQHGYAAILDRYRQHYAGKDQMGKLTFSDLEIRPLDARFAIVTGHYHLERTQAAGGNAQGVFSLVFEKTGDGWKIILDHTS